LAALPIGRARRDGVQRAPTSCTASMSATAVISASMSAAARRY
jgi:hypothetical protein